MNSDPAVRDGAPVCNECYEAWTSDENTITYIPAGPERAGLNPEASAALDEMIERAMRRVAERDQRANESANVWANAFEQGGEEAAREALKEHLQKYQTMPPEEV